MLFSLNSKTVFTGPYRSYIERAVSGSIPDSNFFNLRKKFKFFLTNRLNLVADFWPKAS